MSSIHPVVVEKALFKKLIYLFILVGGQLLYNIVVALAIHLHESVTGAHMYPLSEAPNASLPTPSLWVVPEHQL